MPSFFLVSLPYAVSVYLYLYLYMVMDIKILQDRYSFCLESLESVLCSTGVLFYPSAFGSAIISRCSCKLLHLLTKANHATVSAVREQHYSRMPEIQESFCSSLLPPFYMLVARYCKCKLVWPLVGMAEPVLCVKPSPATGIRGAGAWTSLLLGRKNGFVAYCL